MNFCPTCGGVLSPGEPFCPHCGESLGGSPVATQPQEWHPTAAPHPRQPVQEQRRSLAGPVVLLAVAVLLLAGVLAGGLWWLLSSRVTDTARPTPAQSATSAPSLGSPVAPTRTPRASTATATRATPPPGPTVRSLPTGSFLTILDSLPKGEVTEADAWVRARGLSAAGYSVVVVDSTAISGLNPGYWALSVTGLPSRDAARQVCAGFGRAVGGQCYDREVK